MPGFARPGGWDRKLASGPFLSPVCSYLRSVLASGRAPVRSRVRSGSGPFSRPVGLRSVLVSGPFYPPFHRV